MGKIKEREISRAERRLSEESFSSEKLPMFDTEEEALAQSCEDFVISYRVPDSNEE